MDRYQMWDDTQLIVATDHGFLLGEHDCWAKNWMPFYNEIAHTPFFIWDPRSRIHNERREALVQPAIDIAPTVLKSFGLDPTERMTGCDLADTVADDTPVRETAVFGLFGAHVNITDGRYVYMRGNPGGQSNQPLFDYTLMPAHMRTPFPHWKFEAPLESATFDFTQGCHVMKLRTPMSADKRFETQLYDLKIDPVQGQPIRNEAVESRLQAALSEHLEELDAPAEQWERLGLSHSVQAGSTSMPKINA